MSNVFKSEIAPKGMNFNINDFMISDKYATILTIISYPKMINEGYEYYLINNGSNVIGFNEDIVQTEIPVMVSNSNLI